MVSLTYNKFRMIYPLEYLILSSQTRPAGENFKNARNNARIYSPGYFNNGIVRGVVKKHENLCRIFKAAVSLILLLKFKAGFFYVYFLD